MYTVLVVQRVDIVWDQYKADSLKWQTRTDRGQGVLRIISDKSAVPKDWGAFLQNSENKI